MIIGKLTYRSVLTPIHLQCMPTTHTQLVKGPALLAAFRLHSARLGPLNAGDKKETLHSQPPRFPLWKSIDCTEASKAKKMWSVRKITSLGLWARVLNPLKGYLQADPVAGFNLWERKRSLAKFRCWSSWPLNACSHLEGNIIQHINLDPALAQQGS